MTDALRQIDEFYEGDLQGTNALAKEALLSAELDEDHRKRVLIGAGINCWSVEVLESETMS